MKISKIKVSKYDSVQINVRTRSGHLTRLVWFWSAGTGFRRNDSFMVTLPKRYHDELKKLASGKKFQKRLRNAVRQAAGECAFMRRLEGVDL